MGNCKEKCFLCRIFLPKRTLKIGNKIPKMNGILAIHDNCTKNMKSSKKDEGSFNPSFSKKAKKGTIAFSIPYPNAVIG